MGVRSAVTRAPPPTPPALSQKWRGGGMKEPDEAYRPRPHF